MLRLESVPGVARGIDLGSLRAGGHVVASSHKTSASVMEIYIQEVVANKFTHRLDSACRDRVLRLAGASDRALCSAEFRTKGYMAVAQKAGAKMEPW